MLIGSCECCTACAHNIFLFREIEQLQHKVARYEGRDSALQSGLQEQEDIHQTTEQSRGQNQREEIDKI